MKEWPPRSNKGIWPKKRRGNDKGLSGGARHLPPEARSRRRDAGSGQAAIRVVATDHAHPRLADLSSLNPIRWRSSHRPRTEAKSRRRMSQVERGIDKQRPVTEARIMHHALSFCTAMRGPRALDRSGLDRFDCDSLCNAFGLICRLGGVSGLAAPRLKDRMA
jgi:hypothetical protein